MSESSRSASATEKLCSALFTTTLFQLPWVGVGLAQLLLQRELGTGVQPALACGAVLLLGVFATQSLSLDGDGERLLAALLWTVLGSAAIWNLDELGLAGEQAWSKTLKQCVQLVYFVGLTLVPILLLARSKQSDIELRRWERGLSAGLLLAACAGLYQAAAFYVQLPGASALMDVLGSNPSIAAGSDELYLGDRFVGIPRVRSGAAEPLYFGSYLLFALPACALGWIASTGLGRWWRSLALLLGSSCLLLTFSRGVYLALAMQVTLLLLGLWRGILPRPSRRKLIVTLVLVVAGATFLAAIFTGGAPWELPSLMWRRMAQSWASHDLSNLTRLSSWEAAWRIYLANPLGGVGWGGFGFSYFRAGLADAGAAIFGWPVTNNVLLRMLAETGSVGALLWLLCLRAPLAPLSWLAHRSSPMAAREPVAFVASTCVAGMLIQMLTFSQLNLPHLWLCVGLSAALSRRVERRG